MSKEQKRDPNAHLQYIGEHLDECTIGPDQPFKFHCTKCGKCCIDRDDILLNPQDIYRMAKKLQMTPVQFINTYCNAYIGNNSNVPIIQLAPKEVKEGEKAPCPMLSETGECRVHSAKPTVCAMFPIGRAAQMDLETKMISEPKFIFIDPKCGDNTETHTPREWLTSFGIPVKDEFFMEWQTLVMYVSGLVTTLFQMAEKMEPSDRERFMKLVDGCEMLLLNVMYARYDVDQPFMEQFLHNRDLIHEKMAEVQKFAEAKNTN